MKLRYWVLIAILAGFGGCTYGFLSGLRTDVYHGRVVDEETGLPLAGTVVAVIWYKSSYLAPEGGPKEFLAAQETATKADGTFSLRVSSGLDWDPTTVRVDPPEISIFKPGYEPNTPAWLVRGGFNTYRPLVPALVAGITLKLRKLKSKEEIEMFTSYGPVGVPSNAIPKFIAVVNEQRKLAGFEPLL